MLAVTPVVILGIFYYQSIFEKICVEYSPSPHNFSCNNIWYLYISRIEREAGCHGQINRLCKRMHIQHPYRWVDQLFWYSLNLTTWLFAVRSFSAIGLEVERYAGRVDISYGFARRLSISVGAFMVLQLCSSASMFTVLHQGLMTVLIMGSIVLVLWYGGTLVIHGSTCSIILICF